MTSIQEDGPPSQQVAMLESQNEEGIPCPNDRKVKQEPGHAASAGVPPTGRAPKTISELYSFDIVVSVIRDHPSGAERAPSTVGSDITYIRQLKQGM